MLKVNEYGGRQAKGNEKRQCFKGWETLVHNFCSSVKAIWKVSTHLTVVPSKSS